MKFSLKSLIIFVTISAIFAGVVGYQYRYYERKIDALTHAVEVAQREAKLSELFARATQIALNSRQEQSALLDKHPAINFATPESIHEKEVVESFEAKVVAITDGDIINVLVDKKEVKVRLESVDTPEKGQPFGDKAKKAVGELVFGKSVVIHKTGLDRDGRTLAFVFVDGVDVCAEMVKKGLAWNYVGYSISVDLALLEEQAREAKVGLWANEKPIAPWEWRAKEKAN